MKKVLVVVDMQNDFISGSLGNLETKGVVPNVVDAIKSGDYDYVVTTMDTHFNNYLDTQEGKRLPVPHCIVATDGWELNEDVSNAIKGCFDIYSHYSIQKYTFGSIELADKLQRLVTQLGNDTEIHFCGVCTGICVISNVLIAKARIPDTRICVIKDACACVSIKSHENALKAMELCQIDLI